MSEMNPDAKEFVPAYILKKRQEESERLGELAQQLGQVDIKSAETTQSDANASSRDNSSSEGSNQVQDNSSDSQNVGASKAKTEFRNHSQASGDDQHEQPARGPKENGTRMNNNNAHCSDDYQDSNEDDRYLLNAGEGFCEFNGEQFIIPGE